MSRVRTAFVPGAGLGKRLRPLTEERPKPLVPVRNRPLITHVFDALIGVGIERFVVNTHHRPEAYEAILGRDGYRGREVRFIFEPTLLETGGGIWNARELLGREPVLVHNGDVFADLNLAALLAGHAAEGAEVTALLRSKDGPLQVRFDRRTRRVTDFRGVLGARAGVETLFTGAYVIEPEFVDRIPPGRAGSVIPVFLDVLREGGVGFQSMDSSEHRREANATAFIAGVLDDSGSWADLGDRGSYLAAHRGDVVVDETATRGEGGELRGFVAIGASAEIGRDVTLEDTVVWEGAKIASGARLRGCIVRDHRVVPAGTYADTDF